MTFVFPEDIDIMIEVTNINEDLNDTINNIRVEDYLEELWLLFDIGVATNDNSVVILNLLRESEGDIQFVINSIFN